MAIVVELASPSIAIKEPAGPVGEMRILGQADFFFNLLISLLEDGFLLLFKPNHFISKIRNMLFKVGIFTFILADRFLGGFKESLIDPLSLKLGRELLDFLPGGLEVRFEVQRDDCLILKRLRS